jgi:hypothetical protein
MAHPSILLAIANTCHADMQPSMRTQTIRVALASLTEPSVADVDVPDECDAEFAMNLLDALERVIYPTDSEENGPMTDDETEETNEHTKYSVTVTLLLLLLLCYFCLSRTKT